MPQGRSGLSTRTALNTVLDAGEVWINIDVTALEDGSATDPWGDATAASGAVRLGGTRGGNTFAVNRVIRQMPVDGAIGPIKGFNRRQTSTPTLTVNALEISEENVEYAIAGANNAAAGVFAKITGGEIEDTDYITNVAIASTVKGTDTPIVIVITNAMVMEAPELTFTDEDEVVMSISFVGHVLASAPNTEAFAIYHPGTVNPA